MTRGIDYKTHNKFWMVTTALSSDRKISTLGIIGVYTSNLNEFGFLVDDADYAREASRSGRKTM
jgi:hypothetical protein